MLKIIVGLNVLFFGAGMNLLLFFDDQSNTYLVRSLIFLGIAAFIFFWNPMSRADYFKYHSSHYEEPRTPGELNFIRDKKFNKGRFKYDTGKSADLFICEKAAKLTATKQGLYFYDEAGTRLDDVHFSEIKRVAENFGSFTLFSELEKKKHLPPWLPSSHNREIGK